MYRIILIFSSFLFFNLSLFCQISNPLESEFQRGFKIGFKEGYCYGSSGSTCFTPSVPLPPLPNLNESKDSYRDGYNRGFQVGLDLKRSSTQDNRDPFNPPTLKFKEYVPQLPKLTPEQIYIMNSYEAERRSAQINALAGLLNAIFYRSPEKRELAALRRRLRTNKSAKSENNRLNNKSEVLNKKISHILNIQTLNYNNDMFRYSNRNNDVSNYGFSLAYRLETKRSAFDIGVYSFNNFKFDQNKFGSKISYLQKLSLVRSKTSLSFNIGPTINYFFSVSNNIGIGGTGELAFTFSKHLRLSGSYEYTKISNGFNYGFAFIF